jgi:hypothetical protein
MHNHGLKNKVLARQTHPNSGVASTGGVRLVFRMAALGHDGSQLAEEHVSPLIIWILLKLYECLIGPEKEGHDVHVKIVLRREHRAERR